MEDVTPQTEAPAAQQALRPRRKPAKPRKETITLNIFAEVVEFGRHAILRG